MVASILFDQVNILVYIKFISNKYSSFDTQTLNQTFHLSKSNYTITR